MRLAKGKNTIPHPQRKSGKKAARAETKRLEALARQERYNSLTTEEKIALIKSRPGKSERELGKLLNAKPAASGGLHKKVGEKNENDNQFDTAQNHFTKI